MNINYEKALIRAQLMATKAKPFILKQGTDIYTAVFNQNHWHYEVFQNGAFYLNINEKSASKAKKFLINYLQN